jgi:poly-gamma-glutamate synthesis protein (capsule biosynthesis protein)
MQHESQLKSARINDSAYNYNSCYTYIAPIFSQADIVVANLEVPLGSAPYSGYPAFCAPESYASALKNAGVHYMITANNHSCDRGKNGIEGTITKLDSMSIAHTGMFKSSEERKNRYPLLVEKNGFKIALLNYTYGTNGVAIPQPYVVNIIDTAQIRSDVETAKNMQPDAIFACMHWGAEYELKPNKEQVRLNNFLNKIGVNFIIGSHPHVVQPMIFQPKTASAPNDKLTIYSLGNFLSNQRKPNTDGGAMVRLVLSKVDGVINVDSVNYALNWVYTPTENGRKKFYILPVSQFENSTAFFAKDTSALRSIQVFAKTTRTFLNKENKRVSEWNTSVQNIAHD